MTLIDSNVLIDILTDHPIWAEWSFDRLHQAASRGPLLINDVIYAEVSAGYLTIEQFDQALAALGVNVAPMPPAALFLAAKVFIKYRQLGGTRTGVLPDFFIGAQAQIERLPVLTRDARKYRMYFPLVTLITPDSA